MTGSPADAGNRLTMPLAEAFESVPVAWRAVTDPFLHSPAGAALCEFVDARVRAGVTVYPRRVFRALELSAPAEVRVVILGQDPYHGPGQAQGLAFSVAPGHKVPPSLRNMLREVAADTGMASQCRDDLTTWAQQGVLLLNSVLTVEHGAPQSHAGRGWEVLTDSLLARLALQATPIAFMLWGASAQKKRALFKGTSHGVLSSNHPSPAVRASAAGAVPRVAALRLGEPLSPRS